MSKIRKLTAILLTLVMVIGVVATASISAGAAGNNRLETATPILTNTVYTDNIKNESDIDCYKFYIDSPSKLSISFVHNEFDSDWAYWEIKLLDLSNEELTKFYVDGKNRESANIGVPDGTYYIMIKPYESFRDDDYSFVINAEATTDWETENNNEYSKADHINLNTYYNGTIGKNGDVDYYKFSVNCPSKINLKFKHIDLGLSANAWSVKLYSYDGKEFVTLDSAMNEKITSSCNIGIPSGTYYIKITGDQFVCGIDYSFKVDSEAVTDWETEKNDEYSKADNIKLNTYYNGTISTNRDVDYYKFSVNSKSKVRINFRHSEIDLSWDYWNVILRNSDEEELIKLDSYGDTISETSSYIETPPGTYYIKITSGSYHSDIDYSFSVNAVAISPINPTSVSLNATSLSLEVGNTYTLKATVSPSNATNKTVTWSSSNTSVAIVSSSGYVTAKAAGTATITAKTSNGKTATCKVTVKPKTVNPTSISLNRSTLTLGVGEGYTLTKSIYPSNATTSLSWSSSNTSVVTVYSNGYVTAKKAGTATITVKTSNGKTANCVVTVKKAPTKISLNKTSITLGVGETFDLDSKLPSGEGAYKITYTSNNSYVASVKSSGGLVTAQRVGTATITATTYNGKKVNCTVTVKRAPTKISLNKTSITLGIGETFDLDSKLPSGEASYKVTYTSNNSYVASVKSSGGLVTAQRVGTATITATTYNGKKVNCTVTVKRAPTKISLNKTSITLRVGETFDLDSKLPSGEASYKVTYTSNNSYVASVKSSGGLVTAQRAGTATITATTYNGRKAICKVTVR